MHTANTSETAEVDGNKILFQKVTKDPSRSSTKSVIIQRFLTTTWTSYDPDEDFLGYYSFRNDSIYPILPSFSVNKNFDNLPRKAKTQTISANRLMYGNYLDGFDDVATNAEVETLFENVDQYPTPYQMETSLSLLLTFWQTEVDFTTLVQEGITSDSL